MVQKNRFTFEKLVRDQMLDIWRDQDVSVAHRILNKSDYEVELKKKLLEEAKEAVEAKNKQDLLEELADVLEVLMALGKSYNFSLDDIDEQRLKKVKNRGGFEEKVYCQYVEIVPSDKNKESYEYFLNHTDRYPKESF